MQIQSARLSSSARPAFPLLSIGKLGTLLLSTLCFLLLAQPVLHGQDRYSPDHPEVHEAATQGIEYLKQNVPTDVGESILAGIASIEYSKRYFGQLPVNDILVENALDKALAAMNARSPLPNKHKIYAPCLAVILFCSCDAERYQGQIKELLTAIEDRQNRDGGFGYTGGDPSTGDTSQIQYVALALWVAKSHGFDIDPEVGKDCLSWLCQSQQPSGSWFYRIKEVNGAYPANGRTEHTQSVHCAGLGSVYLLGDYLGLTPNSRQNDLADELVGLDLPVSVSIHIPGNNDDQIPTVQFDRDLFDSAKKRGNRWLDDGWAIEIKQWNYYYLYALERYAYFRESSEDVVKEVPDWYDRGVDFLLPNQTDSGNWPKGAVVETQVVNTSFAIMFLVRASELLVGDERGGTLTGHPGFPEPVKINGVNDIASFLNEKDLDLHDLEPVIQAMKKSINEMAANDDRSRNELVSFLRGLLAHQNSDHRKIAIRLLAGVQDIENAPALIYALGDPEHSVRVAAHNGLRLISRKLDSIQLPQDPTKQDFAAIKIRWSQWYLGINPTGKLLD